MRIIPAKTADETKQDLFPIIVSKQGYKAPQEPKTQADFEQADSVFEEINATSKVQGIKSSAVTYVNGN